MLIGGQPFEIELELFELGFISEIDFLLEELFFGLLGANDSAFAIA